MQDQLDHPEATGSSSISDTLVRDQLARVLQSPLFSHSRRYAPLLRFIVEESLAGHAELLKERLLGVQLFGRAPGYDTAADPIVRVTVAEVRKRLAQYYQVQAHRHELRIELPPGRYLAEFQPGEGPGDTALEIAPGGSGQSLPVEPSPAVSVEGGAPMHSLHAPSQAAPDEALGRGAASRSRTVRWWRVLVAGVALSLCAAAAALLWGHRQPRPAEDLWALVAVPGRQVTICLPTDVGKHHGALTQAAYLANMGKADEPWNATESRTSFLEHETEGENVVFSDAVASIRIAGVLSRRSQVFHVRLNTSTTLDDLRQGPAILIGGLDNQWSLQALAPFRYRFAGDDTHGYWISDVRSPGDRRWFLDLRKPYNDVNRDYALVALVHNEEAGEPQMVVAGIGMSGTMAAGEFVSDAAELGRLQHLLGPAARDHDFEAVLSTDVVRGVSGKPKIEAVWVRQ